MNKLLFSQLRPSSRGASIYEDGSVLPTSTRHLLKLVRWNSTNWKEVALSHPPSPPLICSVSICPSTCPFDSPPACLSVYPSVQCLVENERWQLQGRRSPSGCLVGSGPTLSWLLPTGTSQALRRYVILALQLQVVLRKAYPELLKAQGTGQSRETKKGRWKRKDREGHRESEKERGQSRCPLRWKPSEMTPWGSALAMWLCWWPPVCPAHVVSMLGDQEGWPHLIIWITFLD